LPEVASTKLTRLLCFSGGSAAAVIPEVGGANGIGLPSGSTVLGFRGLLHTFKIYSFLLSELRILKTLKYRHYFHFA
jgi:hypothetical protein